MALMDMFRQAPTTPVTPAPVVVAPVTPPAGTPNAGEGSNVQVNPLDAYTKLFDNTNKNTEVAPVFSLDPKVLGEVSASMDFTQGISPELMQQAQGGDTKALIQMMQHVGRQAYQSAMNHNTTLTDKFVGARSAYDLKSVGSKVKSELTSSALAGAPNANHPVVKQELTRIANALQAEHPDSSPQQIAEAAQKYFADMYSAMNPTEAAPAVPKGETDWGAYFKS